MEGYLRAIRHVSELDIMIVEWGLVPSEVVFIGELLDRDASKQSGSKHAELRVAIQTIWIDLIETDYIGT